MWTIHIESIKCNTCKKKYIYFEEFLFFTQMWQFCNFFFLTRKVSGRVCHIRCISLYHALSRSCTIAQRLVVPLCIQLSHYFTITNNNGISVCPCVFCQSQNNLVEGMWLYSHRYCQTTLQRGMNKLYTHCMSGIRIFSHCCQNGILFLNLFNFCQSNGRKSYLIVLQKVPYVLYIYPLSITHGLFSPSLLFVLLIIFAVLSLMIQTFQTFKKSNLLIISHLYPRSLTYR